MKYYLSAFCLFILLLPTHLSSAQEDIHVLIDKYYELSDSKSYKSAAEMAIKIGEQYESENRMSFAKKFYEFAINESVRSGVESLQAEAFYKTAWAAYKYSEGVGGNDQKDLLEDAAKNFDRAAGKFKNTSLNQSEKHILAHFYGGLALYNLKSYNKAIDPLQYALEWAQKRNNKEIAIRSAETLSRIGSLLDNQSKAEYYQSIYQNYKEFDSAVDSLEKTKQTNQTLNQTIEKKEEELYERNLALENAKIKAENDALLLKRRQDMIKYMSIGGTIVLILLFVSYRAYRFTKKAKRQLESKNKEILKQKNLVEKRQKELSAEKAKSEKLLLNILPKPIATELRDRGRTKPLFYKQVTVMFTDFKGFTKLAGKLSPSEIVKELDVCFMAFDNIIEKHNLEKIKTMGDGYMCAGGVPVPNKTNPEDAVKAAIEMQAFMEKRKEEKFREGNEYFELRIGIHTGPVIAGVVGRKKFAYDIWGDTVNVASRMETSGTEGRINISGDTFAHVKDKFFFTHRGKILAKNKGEIDMFYVDGKVKYAAKSG